VMADNSKQPASPLKQKILQRLIEKVRARARAIKPRLATLRVEKPAAEKPASSKAPGRKRNG
jgi:hypothetical protein